MSIVDKIMEAADAMERETGHRPECAVISEIDHYGIVRELRQRRDWRRHYFVPSGRVQVDGVDVGWDPDVAEGDVRFTSPKP